MAGNGRGRVLHPGSNLGRPIGRERVSGRGVRAPIDLPLKRRAENCFLAHINAERGKSCKARFQLGMP